MVNMRISLPKHPTCDHLFDILGHYALPSYSTIHGSIQVNSKYIPSKRLFGPRACYIRHLRPRLRLLPWTPIKLRLDSLGIPWALHGLPWTLLGSTLCFLWT